MTQCMAQEPFDALRASNWWIGVMQNFEPSTVDG